MENSGIGPRKKEKYKVIKKKKKKKMVSKVNMEAPVHTKAKAKANEKALKAKKAVLKGHKKKIRTSPSFQWPKTL